MKKNALRCFLITNTYYSSAKWHILNEYSYLQLARFFFDIKDFFQSVIFQKLALNEAKSIDSVDKHNNIVNEFARILKTIDNERKNKGISEEYYIKIFSESENINLPRVPTKKIDIFLESDNLFRVNIQENHLMKSFSDELSFNMEDNVKWIELLEKINSKNKNPEFQMNILSSIREKSNFRLFDSRYIEEKNKLFNKKERFCYVGDTIFIVFEFENPLKIQLEVKNILPLYEFEPISGNLERNSNFFNEKASEYFDISIEKMMITPLSLGNQCFLKIVPKIPGKLKILGIQWTLFKMSSRYLFDFKGKKLKDGVSYDKNLKNVFEIFPRTSNLLISIEDFEETIYFGEIKTLNFRIKNSGAQKIKKLFLSTSHPHFFGFSCKKLEDCELDGGESKTLSLFIRGSFLQKTEIRLLFKYILEENFHKNLRIVLPIKVIRFFLTK